MMIKGKRSKRPRPSSPLALTMATSSSTTEFSSVSRTTSDHRITLSTSNSVEFARITDEDEDEDEEEDMANCLILLAKGLHDQKSHHDQASTYQCKTCNKSFHSFQALGGHRASHKIKPNKPNEPNTDHNGSLLSLQIPTRVIVGTSPQNKSRVHECSICGAEFASGQALGGHMRRHRPVAPPEKSRDDDESQEVKRQRNMLSLDLNLPAPEDDSKFNPYANKEQVIVFSASPLVDCQY